MAEEELFAEPPEEEDGLGEEEHDDANRAVASSMVASWGYDRAAEQLQVFFTNGKQNTYDCSPTQWEDAKQATSPGRWMHLNVL